MGQKDSIDIKKAYVSVGTAGVAIGVGALSAGAAPAVIVATGAAALLGGVGYGVYRMFSSEDDAKPQKSRKSDSKGWLDW